jgi:MtN3 and saliva related transmembrane protein
MDNVFELMGFTASIIISISFIPQTYKTITTDQIKDLSYSFMILNIVASSMMVAYGFHKDVIPVVISNTSVLINCSVMLYYMYTSS